MAVTEHSQQHWHSQKTFSKMEMPEAIKLGAVCIAVTYAKVERKSDNIHILACMCKYMSTSLHIEICQENRSDFIKNVTDEW